MRVVGMYSFKGGKEEVTSRYADLMVDVNAAVKSVKAKDHRTKVSREKTMPGRMLYSPRSINKAFKSEFIRRGWVSVRVPCEYPTEFYLPDYKPQPTRGGAFREMDFVKDKLGVEVQFGKYAFMVYNVCAKMTIFRKLEFIDAGIEIVPVKAFADQMSTGVSYFEQFLWDLQSRGIADIDIPVLILGVDA